MKTRNFVAANYVINNPEIARDKSFYKYNCICKKIQKMKKHIFIVLLVVFAALGQKLNAQVWGVKTNLLYDATTTINLGAEVALAPKWSLDLSGNLNAWAIDGKKIKHWLVQPEVRYWFCDRFMGHFVGAHLLGGIYNLGNIDTDIKFFGNDFSLLKNSRYQGWAVGCGVAYGYVWALSRHFNLELEAAIGYAYTVYDRFECDGCGRKIVSDQPYHYFGPTKAAVNLMYVF